MTYMFREIGRAATMLAAGVLFMGLIAGSPARADDAADGPTLSDIVKKLEAEAKEFDQSKRWFRDRSDFSSKNPMKAEPEEIAAALARKYGRPHHDAYVKWQLIEYLGLMDLRKVSDSRKAALVRGVPRYTPVPPPDRRTLAALNQLSEKKLNDREREIHMKLSDRLKSHYQQYDDLNKPAAEYRKKLADMFKVSDSARYIIIVDDMQDRIRANLDVNDQLKDLKNKSAFLSRLDDLSVRDRKIIYSRLERLKGLKGKKYEIKYDKKKSHHKLNTKTVEAKDKDIRYIQDYLLGKEPEEVRKKREKAKEKDK